MPTPPLTRQQRRQQERKLVDQGKSVVARGFPPDLDDDATLAAAHALRAKLKEPGNAARASEAAALACALLDKSNAELAAGPSVACKRGCSMCCTTSVSATAPEIFRLARHLHQAKGLPLLLARSTLIPVLRAKAAIEAPEGTTAREPCALLEDHACSVYAVRPLSCRQLLSTSAETCRAVYNGEKVPVAFLDAALTRGVLARIVLLGAVRSVGLDDTSYELGDALASALETPNAEARWLAGENVFSAAKITPRPPSTQAFIDRTARLLDGQPAGKLGTG